MYFKGDVKLATKKEKEKDGREKRKRGPFMDRRSGEDRRETYLLDYFEMGKRERRSGSERRTNIERRTGCVRISKWSSVCPDYSELESDGGRIEIP